MILVVAPIAAAYAAAVARAAGHLRVARGLPAPHTRKVFHFAIFTAAGVLQLMWGLSAVAVFGGVVSLIVLHALWRGEGHPLYEALARPSDGPRRSRFVVIPWAATASGGLLANLFFPAFGHVGYLVAGWGDAIGEPVGTRWGRHRYRVPSLFGIPATRSIEGSSAVFLLGTLAAILALWAADLSLASAVAIGLACGVVGAVVEAASNHGLDNLTVQIASAGTAVWLAG